MTQILLTIIRLNSQILTLVSKIASKNATSLPGLAVEKHFTFLIAPMSRGLENITLITGTNGKTTTRALAVHLLQNNGQEVLTNIGGANIMRGIATALLANLDMFNKPKIKRAVLEVEEATLPKLTKYMKVDKLVLTNIFRDQLDAYGSIDQTLAYFEDSIKQIRQSNPNLKVVINFDDHKLVSCIPDDFDPKNLITFGTLDKREQIRFEAGRAQIEHGSPDLGARDIAETYKGLTFQLVNRGENQGQMQSRLPGFFNVYNILAAIATSEQFDAVKLREDLRSFAPAFGRGEIIELGQSEIILYLVKNPAGFDEILRLLPDFAASNPKHPKQAFFLINDRIADGRDVSWLWDTDFETHLGPVEGVEYQTGGQRGLDMLLRLETAGVKVGQEDYWPSCQQIVDSMEQKSGRYFVCCTYTALLEIRGILEQKTAIGSINKRGN